MVRPHPLQPAERQALGCDRADHAPAARGRPRRPCVGPGGVGGRATAGNCRGGRAAPGRDGVRAAGLWPQRGEALYPEREPPEMLEQLRRTLGEYNFAGQYQQAPSPLSAGMIKAAWFKSYAANERPEKFDHIVQSWDTANKASELSDFSVCTSWGIKGKDLYLLHVLRRRMEYPELKRAVIEQCEAFAASVVLIEDKASGTQLIQELIDYGLHAVTRYQPQSDKIMRMHAQTAMIENGFVHLPKEAAWLPEYLHELTAFPKGKHDDQVDSTAQMLDWLKRAGGGPTSNAGIFELTRRRADE